jgi:hypothetical protein
VARRLFLSGREDLNRFSWVVCAPQVNHAVFAAASPRAAIGTEL